MAALKIGIGWTASTVIANASWWLAWVFTNTFGFMYGWVSGRAWGLSAGGDFYDLGHPVAAGVLFVSAWVTVVCVTQWFTLLQLGRPQVRTNLKLLGGLFLMPVFSVPMQGLVEVADERDLPGVLEVAGAAVAHPPVQGLIVACLLALYWFHARRQSLSATESASLRMTAWLGGWVFALTLGIGLYAAFSTTVLGGGTAPWEGGHDCISCGGVPAGEIGFPFGVVTGFVLLILRALFGRKPREST
jgi:hypothetical protein